MGLSETGTAGYVPHEERNDFMAVIVGPTGGWTNYRHQADALGVYTMLRENGVPDDKIILMIYDDIPYLQENPIKGDVHNIPAGENLRYGAIVVIQAMKSLRQPLKRSCPARQPLIPLWCSKVTAEPIYSCISQATAIRREYTFLWITNRLRLPISQG